MVMVSGDRGHHVGGGDAISLRRGAEPRLFVASRIFDFSSRLGLNIQALGEGASSLPGTLPRSIPMCWPGLFRLTHVEHSAGLTC
jgi:hypothetical protein